MIIPEEKLIKIILELFSIFNYECILTGSAADYFHIGYLEVEDIDVTIDSLIYDKYITIDNQYKTNLKLSLKMRNTKDNHILYRYYYDKYIFDIFSKSSELISDDITIVKINNKNIKVFSPLTRLEQLKNNRHRANLRGEALQKKIQKINDRIEIYNKLINNDNNSC